MERFSTYSDIKVSNMGKNIIQKLQKLNPKMNVSPWLRGYVNVGGIES
jgi:hypothetical protein